MLFRVSRDFFLNSTSKHYIFRFKIPRGSKNSKNNQRSKDQDLDNSTDLFEKYNDLERAYEEEHEQNRKLAEAGKRLIKECESLKSKSKRADNDEIESNDEEPFE
jgi:hypothetical protein